MDGCDVSHLRWILGKLELQNLGGLEATMLSFRIAVAAFVLLSLLLFTRRFDDIRASWDDYRAGARLDDLHHNLTLGAKPPSDITIAEVSQGPPTSATSTATSSTVHDEEPGPTEAPGSKVIVMAKLERENTDWVAEYLLECARPSSRSGCWC